VLTNKEKLAISEHEKEIITKLELLRKAYTPYTEIADLPLRINGSLNSIEDYISTQEYATIPQIEKLHSLRKVEQIEIPLPEKEILFSDEDTEELFIIANKITEYGAIIDQEKVVGEFCKVEIYSSLNIFGIKAKQLLNISLNEIKQKITTQEYEIDEETLKKIRRGIIETESHTEYRNILINTGYLK
jgi:hypothetical protein